MIEFKNKLDIYFDKNIIGAIIQIYDIGSKQTLLCLQTFWSDAPIDLCGLMHVEAAAPCNVYE